MNQSDNTKRSALIRESLVFQLKLIADGTRDLVLVPVSLVATVIGVLRGGENPAREFNQVLDLGRQTERWINLFGNHQPIEEAGRAGSIDMLLTHAEEVVREQAREGGISESAARAIDKALEAAHRKARGDRNPPDRGIDI